MRAFYLTGRQVSALELFRETRALLDEELGVEPGLALQRLERAILNHDPELGDVVLPPRFRTVGRRAPLLVLAGGALLVIAAVAAAVVLSSGGSGIKSVAANSVVAIDPAKGEIVADVVVGNRPSRLAATPDTVWAVNSGDGTISQIDNLQPRVLNTFGPSSVPTDIVATGNVLWVGNALAGKGPLAGTNAPATLSRFDVTRHAPLGTIRLPHSGFAPMAGRAPETRFVVAGAGVVWSIALDGTVVGVDGAGRVRHHVELPAASLAYGDHALWVLTQDNHVVRVDAATGAVKQTIAVPSVLNLGGIAAGGGAVWVTSPFQGVLWRIDPGRPPRNARFNSPSAPRRSPTATAQSGSATASTTASTVSTRLPVPSARSHRCPHPGHRRRRPPRLGRRRLDNRPQRPLGDFGLRPRAERERTSRRPDRIRLPARRRRCITQPAGRGRGCGRGAPSPFPRRPFSRRVAVM